MKTSREKREGLFKLKEKKQTPWKLGAFDIETWGLDARKSAFAMGTCVYYTRDKNKKLHKHEKVFFNADAMAEFMLSRRFYGYTWYGHNCFNYDCICLFGNYVKDDRFDIVYSGSRPISMKYRHGQDRKNVFFRDLFALFPMGLEQIGLSLGFEKGVTPEKFKAGDREAEITSEDIEYCLRDSHIVLKAVYDFNKFLFDNWRTVSARTIAATAFTLFRTSFLDKEVSRSGFDHTFRESYFGGRTELLEDRCKKIYRAYYDFNSLYPAVMRETTYPLIARGSCYRSYTGDLTLISSYEGVSLVDVEVLKNDDNWYPLLPYRLNGKLIFPTGRWVGWYNHNELRAAVKWGGVKIHKVYSTIYSLESWNPFKKFVEELYDFRKKAMYEENPMKVLYLKLLMNSLYGKMGQKKLSVMPGFMNKIFPEKGWQFYLEDSDKLWGLWRRLDHRGREIIEDAEHAMVSLASYTTSASRIKLFEAVRNIRNKGYRVTYTDTDSIVTDDYSLDTTHEMGDLKKEMQTWFYFIGPKSYAYLKDDEKTYAEEVVRNSVIQTISDWLIKIKGIRKPESVNTEYQQKRVIATRESIRRHIEPGTPEIMTKKLSFTENKREWVSMTQSVPIHIGI